ncbi:MAG: hypothetical protein LUG27_07905 [Clostridiales bacterium]|nr:hypothetical protein [Clostridiales bacterium]
MKVKRLAALLLAAVLLFTTAVQGFAAESTQCARTFDWPGIGLGKISLDT